MPEYIFQHPVTQEIKSVFQKMTDSHVYFDEENTEWARVFVNPQMGVDTKYDVNNSKDFIKYTSNKKGTMGDLWDSSKEWSEKRGGNSGQDEIKKQYFDQYAKDRKGKRHVLEQKEKLNNILSAPNCPIELE